jgi:HK97 family phage major capsid protein
MSQLINDLKEKRNHLSEQTNLLVKSEMTAETRAKIDVMHADWAEMGKDISRAENAEAMEAEMRSSRTLPASALSTSEARSEAEIAEQQKAVYKGAFRKYLRGSMEDMNVEERKALRSGEVRTQSGASNAAGGYLLQTELASSVEVGLKWFGGMRQVASQFTTSGFGALDWPTLNDTLNPGKRLNATTAPGTADELDLGFAQVVFQSWTYTTQKIAVQNELLQDASYDVEELIREAFVTRIGRVQNTDFTVGTGGTMPNGILTQASLGVQAAVGGTTSITYNNLVDLIHSVDIAYRPGAGYMFNDQTLAAIRKLTNTYGQPLLGLGINGGDPDSVLGYRYQVNNDIPVLAVSAKSALFGQFSKYKIRDIANSMTIMKLDQLGALQNQTIFVGFTRADGNLVDPGTKPVTYFANSAT